MPSLNDIPEPIRTDTNPEIFMAWIRPIPVVTQVKQALATFWMRHTGARLTPAQWQEILNYRIPRKKRNGPDLPAPSQR